MRNVILLALCALGVCQSFAEPPQAGTYTYTNAGSSQAQTMQATDSFRVTLTPGKNGSFGVVGSWSLADELSKPPISHFYSFKGTLSNKGTFKGTLLWPDNVRVEDARLISGFWNTKANGLTITFPAMGAITLTRNSAVTDAKLDHFVLTKTEVGQQPTPYHGWTGTVTATGLNE